MEAVRDIKKRVLDKVPGTEDEPGEVKPNLADKVFYFLARDIPGPSNKPFIGDTSLIASGNEETSLMGHSDVVINCQQESGGGPRRRGKNYGGILDQRALIEEAGKRLSQRKRLYVKKRLLSKVMALLATIGLLLMVFETEMIIRQVYTKSSAGSVFVKLAISASTLVLMAAVVYYHVCEIEMNLIENNLDDWRYAMNFNRISRLVSELIICAIHPPPGNYDFPLDVVTDSGEKLEPPPMYPVDVVLSLPMFLRIYIYCRFAMLHAALFSDAKSQSLGALNRIHFNFAFIFKSYMAMYPGRMLALIVITLYIAGSWSVRACEMYNSWVVDATFANSLWLIAITVLTVGYGDIVPHSYCGRSVATISGALGVACTALLVAVLTKSLELNRKESYVHSFVLDVHLEKMNKYCAQKVIREAWKTYKWRKKGHGYRVRLHMQKLLKAISAIRKVRDQRNRMKDSDITLNEVSVQQSTIQGMIHHIHLKQSTNEARLESLERSVQIMAQKVADMHTLVMSRRPSASGAGSGTSAQAPSSTS